MIRQCMVGYGVFCVLFFHLFSAAAAEYLLIDASAAHATNMGWGATTVQNNQASAPLCVESNAEPSAPYFAEFALPDVKAGEYSVWALLLGCDAPWVSAFTWSMDGKQPLIGAAQTGSGEGFPRWVKLGTTQLAPGVHSIKFEIAGRRSHPDDAYVFTLWQILIGPADKNFSPLATRVELGYNPQVNQGGMINAVAGSNNGAAKFRHIRKDRFDPVNLKVNISETLPDIAPIWRDYSEGGTLPGDDFFIPELVQPLRPRFIRKDHCMPLGKRNPDGSIVYDPTRLIDTVNAIRKVGAEPIIGLELQEATMPHDQAGRIPDRSVWMEDPEFPARWQSALNFAFDELDRNHLDVKYFQCFNEPEYSGYSAHPALAVAIYDLAQQVVRKRYPEAKMFGIGCGDGVSSAWYAFADYLTKNPQAADYFDYHTYQASPQYYVNRLKYLREDLKKRNLSHIRPALTEWGVASSGAPVLRSGMENAIFNASAVKALAFSGLEIACLFSIRDFPQNNYKFGMITTDGYLKPAYWGQWLWAQLPDGTVPLKLTGTSADKVDGIAFKDGDGAAILLWRGGDRREPAINVTLDLTGAQWPGMRIRKWSLDETRHIGLLPQGAPIELPIAESCRIFDAAKMPSCQIELPPLSMCLLKIEPAASARELPKNLRNDPFLYGKPTP